MKAMDSQGQTNSDSQHLWLAEYNPFQRVFHVETLSEALKRNVAQVIESAIGKKEGVTAYFIVFGIFLSQEQALQAIDNLREMLNKEGANL